MGMTSKSKNNESGQVYAFVSFILYCMSLSLFEENEIYKSWFLLAVKQWSN